MKIMLKMAVEIIEQQRDISEQIRKLQSRMRELSAEATKIEKFISKKTNLYYCESCCNWKPKEEMRWVEEDNRLSGRNKCSSCCDEKYFEQLAKASINQSGISLLSSPPELLEIEILRAKTRHALKNKT